MLHFGWADAQTWSSSSTIPNTTGGTGGDIGKYTNLMEVNGRPAIATYNATNSSVVFIRAKDATGTEWEEPVTIDAGGVVGMYISLAIVNGNPAVAYRDAPRGDLLYVRANDANGTSWGNPVVVGGGSDIGGYNVLKVVNGNPAIAYYDFENSWLRYVRATDVNGNAWGVKYTVTASVSAGFASGSFLSPYDSDLSVINMEIVNGNPAMTFRSTSSGFIGYVRANNVNGSSWPAATSLAQGDDPAMSILKVINGNPTIIYTTVLSSQLFYLRANDANGTNWPNSGRGTVIASIRIPSSPALHFVNGSPVICYRNSDNRLGFLRANDANGSSWGTPETVDNNTIYPDYISIAIINGNPAVAYYDNVNRGLKYNRATDNSGNTWGTPVSFSVGGAAFSKYASMQHVNNNPAVAYYEESTGDLRFVRASNSSSTNWGTPLTIDETGDVGASTSLGMVNSNPAIGYYDATNGDLKFVRAADNNGSNWNTPITIDASGNVGSSCKMAVVNGNPSIIYSDSTNNRIMYVRSDDADGGSWGTPINVTSLSGSYSNLIVVNGNPAFVFFDVAGGNIRFVRASDADGSSWEPPITVSALSGYTGNGSCSISIINGNPAIAFHFNGTGKNVSYIRANDVNGSSWGASANIVNGGAGMAYVALTVFNGRPVIAYNYVDAFGVDSLRFIASNNVNGTSWGTAINIDNGGGWYLNLLYNNNNGELQLGYYQPGNMQLTFLKGLVNNMQWTGAAGTTNWFTQSNWDGETVPLGNCTVTIPGGLSFYPNISSSTATVKDLTIALGASTIVSGTGTLQVSGIVNNSGTFNVAAGTLELNGTTAQTIPANLSGGSIKNLTLNNVAGASLTAALNITGIFSPLNGTLAAGNFLTLKSDVNGTASVAGGAANGGYITGNVTVERYVPAKRAWRFITSPVTGSTNNSIFYNWQNNGNVNAGRGIELWTVWSNGGTSNPNSTNSGLAAANGNSIRYYSTGVGWLPVTNTNTTNLFTTTDNNAYSVFITGGFGSGFINSGSSETVISATGVLRTGNITINAGTIGANMFHLVGNPFASPVDPNALSGTNLSNSFYMWDPNLLGARGAGGYVTYNRTLNQYNITSGGYSNSPVSQIQSGQAFFIQAATTGATSITFEETDKTSTNNNGQFRTTATDFENLRITLQKDFAGDNTYINTDGAVASFHATIGSKNIDNYDVTKMQSGTDLIALVRSNTSLTFEHRPLVKDRDTLYLKLSNTSASNYRLQIAPENFATMAGLTAVLKDNFLNTETNISLTDTTNINFAITASAASTGDRFVIYFRPASVLPVDFISVKAQREGASVKVSWNVANEKNVTSYSVERSTNGTEFSKIGTVNASNMSGYQYMDLFPINGTNYYRIRSIDVDGGNKLSSVVSVNINGNKLVSLYPNPVKGSNVELRMVNVDAGKYTLRLINTGGQLLFTTAFDHNGGSITRQLQLPAGIVAGVYQLEITNGKEKTIQQLIIN